MTKNLITKGTLKKVLSIKCYKNGTFAQRKEQIFKAAAQEKKSNLVQDKKVVLEQKIIEENIKKNRGLRR